MIVPRRVVDQLIAAHEREREEWAKERRELLNRIQAPERVPFTEPAEPSEEPLYVAPDDDVAYDEYLDDRAAGAVS